MADDRAISDAIVALAESQLRTVDVLRQTYSATMEMTAFMRAAVESLGRISDQQQEIIRQIEISNGRHGESERNMRVVQSTMKDVVERLKPLEADYQARRRAGAGQR